MINQWSVANFKSIQDKVTVDFAPLTLFVGQNSAGKSTLIQSILMTAQTLQSNVASRSVVLNGKILRLGAFSDIRSNNSDDKSVTVGFELKRPTYEIESSTLPSRTRYYYSSGYQEQLKSVRSSFTFSAGTGADTEKELQLQPRIEKGSIGYRSTNNELNFDFDYTRINESPAATLQRLNVAKENVRIPDLSALGYQASSASLGANYRRAYRLPTQTQPAGVILRHFLPISVGAAYDAVEVEVNSAFELLADPSMYGFMNNSLNTNSFSSFSSRSLQKIYIDACMTASETLPAFAQHRFREALEDLAKDFRLENLNRVHTSLQTAGKKRLALLLNEHESSIKAHIRAGRPPRREVAPFPVTEPVSFATDYVTNFFSEKLKYLGPLRDEPKAIYPLAGYNDPKDIGYRGEFTAAVLDNNRTAQVNYVPSSQFPFSTKDQIETTRTNLFVAVRDWLEYLGIARKIATEDKGKLGHEMTIATANGENLHDLTHVGVGVSQAMPIVVLSLLAETGSTLIFEQPELHLHPRVQTRLADFFMSLSFAGKQCIVETHSEYLISRLRYLSALAQEVEISKLIKIYFVEKPQHQSVYSEVTMTETGVIKNWPEGFFDETERNSAAIIQAQIERARKKRAARGSIGE